MYFYDISYIFKVAVIHFSNVDFDMTVDFDAD